MTYVTSVTVSPKNVKIKPGEWYENLNATVLPANADKPFVAWTSSNENVVSVSSFSGAVYGVGLGTAVVYATSIDGTNITDCCTFTVTNNIPITNLALDKTSLSMQLNENRTLSATFLPANATNKALTWCSDNTNVVTVNNGTLSSVATGNAVVTAYTNDGSNLSASCTVKVTTDILVRCITVSDETLSLAVGKSKYITAEVCPTNAKNKNVVWTSSNPSVATVNPNSGLINAISAGSVLITATAADGSGVSGSCQLTVIPYVPVERISIDSTKDVDEGDTFIMSATVFPLNATDNEIVWSSNNTEVAQINSSTGALCALNAGIAHITAKSKSNPSITATCELWVRGKKAVFLLHGRTDNSRNVWGISNNIPQGQNSHSKPEIDASAKNGKKYTDYESQEIINIHECDHDDEEKPCNLGYELQNIGYEKNKNLFVFNYPNEDAVIYSAKKFKEYIKNVISHVRINGSDKEKTCFFESRQAYDDRVDEKYTFNIVAHSMGGLVGRYYIENLGQDKHVDKLITICTPHWGSGYAALSNASGYFHCVCDHDLNFDSAMFGNSDLIQINCNIDGCPADNNYTVTPKLQYQRQRMTKYYAIAGIDYNAALLDHNDYTFEMPTDFTTSQEIRNLLFENNIYEPVPFTSMPINGAPKPKDIFLSQIGWIGDELLVTPEPTIQMERIFVDVDTNGGNILGSGLNSELIYEFGSKILHNKIPHRKPIQTKIIEYLEG